MKLNCATAQALLKLLNGTPVGAAFPLPSPIPALTKEPVQGFVVEQDEKNWTIACYLHGVSIGDIAAYIDGDHLILEDV